MFWNLSGFTFADEEEPTALVQYDGGPCAIIVPVQAFLLKNLLFSGPAVPEKWRCTNGMSPLLCLMRTSLVNVNYPHMPAWRGNGDISITVCLFFYFLSGGLW